MGNTYFEKWNQWRIEFLGLAVGWYGKGPYVNFSYSSARYDFKRATVYAFRRARHGWADNDTWSFDYYLADVISGGLKHLKKHKMGIPGNLLYGEKTEWGDAGPVEKYTMEEAEARWDKILDTIIEGFEAHKQILDGINTVEEDKKLERKFKRGMKLFAKYYGSFWD